MSWTVRCAYPQGYCCARRSLQPAAWRVLTCLIALAAFLGNVEQPSPALAADEIATLGLYLQSGNGYQAGPFVGAYDVNDLMGATRFYNAGLTGTNAVMANIEAGYIWSGHETLNHVGLIPTSGGATGEVDRHATWVGMVMGGRPTDPTANYQRGMAPDAQLVSGAIATSWPNGSSFPRYTTSFFLDSGMATWGPYRAAFITGVTGAGGTRTADVVNSSYVTSNDFNGVTATGQITGTIDALINENSRTLMTVPAGNTVPSGEGPNMVPGVASSYNAITVAGLGPNGGAFDIASYFSNGGPNDYSDPVHTFVSQARQVVDIAAPGENFSTAYYGGETGGNGASLYGPANGPAGGSDWYTRNVSGTSFSAPTVAGGAALLYDAAYARLSSTPDARDARVMKAVLMNAADKTLDWDNGQSAHPSGFGGVLTTQALDNRVGSGRMNLYRAFDQFLSGTTDIAGLSHGALGAVDAIGWDFGEVIQGTANDYSIEGQLNAGDSFTATLDWFRDRRTSGDTGFFDASYDNLDLELWSAVGGVANQLISESRSIYNNVEHFQFAIPTTGEYLLRVRWTEELFNQFGVANSELYGLAWSSVAVPEPATFVMLCLVLPMVLISRHRASR
jgi:hypothetical protein